MVVLRVRLSHHWYCGVGRSGAFALGRLAMTSYWPVIALTWLCGALAVVALLHGRRVAALWREPVLTVPVLIVESDDWGVGPVSDAVALNRLAELLANFRDATGRPAVMTLGVVSGGADGAAILAGDCHHYVRKTLDQPEFLPIVQAMRAGVAAGVFALQRHGLEHFWPDALLARARTDVTLRAWMASADARSERLPSELQSRWVDGSVLPTRRLPPEAIESAVQNEAELLASIFGVAPAVAVPNTFVWNDAVERAWYMHGVRVIVTPGCRYEARQAGASLVAPKHRLVNGQSSDVGACYVVRDVYFEPVRGHRAERVWEALTQLTGLGRPVLLETHRESFIGDPAIVEDAIAELARALLGARQRHPELRFMSTEALAEVMANPASPLRVRALTARLSMFSRRLLQAADLRGIMLLTGLALVAVAVEKITSIATSAWRGVAQAR